MYVNRHLEDEILKATKGFPVLLLTGARQVGKSTLLKHLSGKDRQYVTFDDLQIRQIAEHTPDLFFDIYKPPLLLDEVQYVPELFSYIKMYVDEHDSPGLFWLTGSQMFHLMDNVQESLAGRVSVLNLFPFSQSELWKKRNNPFPPEQDILINADLPLDIKEEPDLLLERIFKGGMPRFVLNQQVDRDQFFSSYLQTYVERDVRQVTNVLDTGLFVNFLQLIASRTAQELNLSSIGSSLGIDRTTARRWLDLLLRAGLVVELPAWSRNLGKRVIKRPKIYLSDTGFCCYLCGIEHQDDLIEGSMAGALFETYVVNEVLKTWVFAGKRPPVFYYRDSNQKEIDLVIERNQKIYPCEIKKNVSPKHAFKNWNILDSVKDELGYSSVICNAKAALPINRNAWQIPWWAI